MNVDTAYESDYIRACDLDDGHEMKLQIKNVERGELQLAGTSKKERKPVIHFKNSLKKLALNKTNKAALVKVMGKETTNWTGATIVLYQAMTKVSGEEVEAVRIKNIQPPKGQQNRKQETRKAATAEELTKTIEAIKQCENAAALDAFLQGIRKTMWTKDQGEQIAAAKDQRLAQFTEQKGNDK